MSDVGQDQKDQEYVDQEQKEPEYTDDHNEFVRSFPLDLSQWKNFYFCNANNLRAFLSYLLREHTSNILIEG